jgi:(1->4)-alpha-D-glucan 1-alpha-D-glucosylmutase
MDSGMPKLWIIHRALHLRREHPEWFGAEAAYTPLYAEGLKKDHVIAYMRGDRVATIVPRWNVKLRAGWSSTSLELPTGRWNNILTGVPAEGGRIRLQRLMEEFPVALLVRESE